MASKMGESQVIDFFSTTFRNKLGDDCYSFGNFSGSQDRKFADVFAGTASSCILIEFKEFESEIRQEHGKPLRKKLCENLTVAEATQSRNTHFIAYSSPGNSMEVTVAPYVDIVCKGFSIGCPPLEEVFKQTHEQFIDEFLLDIKGASHSDFLDYISHLNKTAGGTDDGKNVPFKSILYSKSRSGSVIGTRFENLGQLHKLLNLNSTLSRRHKP